MTDGRLTADVGRYTQATAGNITPSTISSDPLIGGATPIEQMLRMLGLAANSGDPEDNATNAEEHARRAAMTSAAAEIFAAEDALAAEDLTGVMPQDQVPQDQTAATAGGLPQLLAGITGAVSGVLSGLLQPLGQIPQQIAQGAQQVLQAGAGLSPAGVSGDGGFGGSDDGALPGELTDDDLGFTADDVAGIGDATGLDDITGAGGGFGPGTVGAGAVPGVMLAAPANPSAATLPASAPGMPAPVPAAHIPAAGVGAGMAGMPMIPPGGVTGAGAIDPDAKADTKRIAAPPVRNGAPVQGRIAAVPLIIETTVEGKPVAARRVITPADARF